MGSKQVCTCRIGADQIRAELGVDEVSLDGYEVEPDWRGKPSLTVSDAGALVAQFRAEVAAAQGRQDQINAEVAAEERARARLDVLPWTLKLREVRRRDAIKAATLNAIHKLPQPIAPGDEERAMAAAAAEAGARFDRDYPPLDDSDL